MSIHFVNAAGSLLVAPFGGVEKRLSTAPYCVGIPRQGQDPIVLDFATSIVAEGKVLVASRGGKKLPKGALVDADGTLSEDPPCCTARYTPDGPRDHTKGTGAIRAFGEHKGSGLCLHLRAARRRADRHRRDRRAGRFANGMMAFYVDPKVIDTSNFFDGEISRYADFIRATKPIAGRRSGADSGRSRAEDPRRAHQERHPLAGRHLGGDSEHRARGRRQRSQHPAGDRVSTARAPVRTQVVLSRRSQVTTKAKQQEGNWRTRSRNLGLGQGRGQRVARDPVRLLGRE